MKHELIYPSCGILQLLFALCCMAGFELALISLCTLTELQLFSIAPPRACLGLSPNLCHLRWKRPPMLSPTCDHPIVTQTRALSATSNHSSDSSRDGDLTTSLRSLFQVLTTLSMMKFFLMPNLNLHQCNWRLFSLVLSPVPRRKCQPPPGFTLLSDDWKEQ